MLESVVSNSVKPQRASGCGERLDVLGAERAERGGRRAADGGGRAVPGISLKS